MKLLSTYSDNAAFEEEKDKLEENNDYAALAIEERDVHMKEIPDMVDIALWDNTEEKLFMIRGWEYDTDVYPTDRYTPIGVEVIPRSHMDDGHARIMSLVYMRYDTPKVGGEIQNMYFGLHSVDISGITYKNYVPYINKSGTTDFGNIQTIDRWHNTTTIGDFLPSDKFNVLINPFTKNQYYYDMVSNSLPSPYLKNMKRNPIFFTENPDSEHPSCLLNMDGKGETTKILNQLNKNLGNEDWKTGETIENGTGVTNAPACQCCWMYCVDEKYKDNPIFGQGQWYLPTVGELCYLIVRINAINNTLDILKIGEKIINHSFACSSVYDKYRLLGCTTHTGNLENNTRNFRSFSVYAFCLI